MIENKAKKLGIIYTFIITFILLSPFIYLSASLGVINHVAERTITVVDGENQIDYDMDSITPEGWALIKAGRRRAFDIFAGTCLIFALMGGGEFGEKILITKTPNCGGWDDGVLSIFRRSYAVSISVWYAYFMILSHGIFPSFGELLISIFFITAFTLAASGCTAVFFGEPLLRRILRFHKN